MPLAFVRASCSPRLFVTSPARHRHLPVDIYASPHAHKHIPVDRKHLSMDAICSRLIAVEPPRLSVRLLFVVIAGLVAFPGVALADDDPPTTLELIDVTPQIRPLDEPYERLRRMMNDPYCDGCPPLIVADRESIYLTVLKPIGWLTGYGLNVPQMSHQDRLDFHLANDWRMYERLPEN